MILISYMGSFVLCPLGFIFPALALLSLPPNAAAGPTPPAGLAESLVEHGVAYGVQADAKSYGRRGACAGNGVPTILMCAWMFAVGLATVVIAVCKIVSDAS